MHSPTNKKNRCGDEEREADQNLPTDHENLGAIIHTYETKAVQSKAAKFCFVLGQAAHARNRDQLP